MKKYLYILTIILIVFGVYLFQTNKPNQNISSLTTPTVSTFPTITPPSNPMITNEDIVFEISKNFSQKYQKPDGSYDVTISTREGDFAKGMVSAKGEMGGGIWFGTKTTKGWELVFDGNGIILCSDISPYPDFPTSMIPSCLNDKTQEIVKR